MYIFTAQRNATSGYFRILKTLLLHFLSNQNIFFYFAQKWETVNPVGKVLGVRFDHRRNKTTGTYDQVVVSYKIAYVPILQTLQYIFF